MNIPEPAGNRIRAAESEGRVSTEQATSMIVYIIQYENIKTFLTN